MGLYSSKLSGASFFGIKAIKVALKGGWINPLTLDSSIL
jgi:hypothetical protein